MFRVESPDLPGPTAPRFRGGGIAYRRSGPTKKATATLRQGPATETGACPWKGRRVRRWERR
jgi:hypothetical protein